MTKSRGINQPRITWTAAMDAKLRAVYPDNTAAATAEALGIRVQQVYTRACRLGLTKSPAFLASADSGRLGHGQGEHTRIQPGQTPWNRGKRFPGKATATSFRPGRAPEDARNYVAIGTRRLNGDGYVIEKVSDDTSVAPARRWEFVHRLVWERTHGPIPEGHVVAFRAGQRTVIADEITVDRLELITRAETMRRNSVHQYGPEIAEIARLRGAITRQVRKLTAPEETTS